MTDGQSLRCRVGQHDMCRTIHVNPCKCQCHDEEQTP